MDIILQIIQILFWFVIILIPLVAIHEFGHLLISRLFGVRIPEYAIGMPLVKRTFYKRWKGIIWSFYWPLLGGFVRIFGDNDAIDKAYEDSKTDPKSARKNYIQNRFEEMNANRELKFFLEDNNLEYDEKWKWFEQVSQKGLENKRFLDGLFATMLVVFQIPEVGMIDTKIKPSQMKEQITEKYNKMYDQLAVLIEWEYDKEIKATDTFFNKNWIQQTLIISGGVIFNMLAAIFIFWTMFTMLGISNTPTPIDDLVGIEKNANVTSRSNEIIVGVAKDSIAEKAGMKSGDKMMEFAGVEARNINSFESFRNLVAENKNKDISVRFLSGENNEEKLVNFKLEEKDGKATFGVGGMYREVTYKAKNIFAGFGMAWDRTWFIFTETFKVLGQVFAALIPGARDRTALDSVGGPIAVGSIGTRVFEIAGVTGILDIMASVSIGLAVFNILPIPALDGGRWVIITLNKILGKRNQKIEAAVISITFLVLMGLAVVIAFRDIQGVVTGRF